MTGCIRSIYVYIRTKKSCRYCYYSTAVGTSLIYTWFSLDGGKTEGCTCIRYDRCVCVAVVQFLLDARLRAPGGVGQAGGRSRHRIFIFFLVVHLRYAVLAFISYRTYRYASLPPKIKNTPSLDRYRITSLEPKSKNAPSTRVPHLPPLAVCLVQRLTNLFLRYHMYE